MDSKMRSHTGDCTCWGAHTLGSAHTGEHTLGSVWDAWGCMRMYGEHMQSVAAEWEGYQKDLLRYCVHIG
eukprot:scaffold47819_cov21-Tisochrysis_lutea.AAC.3